MPILLHKDTKCVNIHCNKPLTDYELTRQGTKWRYRFCNYCRRMISANRTNIQWKCISCGELITVTTVIGSYYCGSICRKKERANWSKKWYRIKKLAKEINECGGIDKYRTNRQIQPTVA